MERLTSPRAGLARGVLLAVVLAAIGAISVGLLAARPPSPGGAFIEEYAGVFLRDERFDVQGFVPSAGAGLVVLERGHVFLLLEDQRSAVVLNLTSGAVSAAGVLSARRSQPEALALRDGRVLLIGGDLTDPVGGVSSVAHPTGEIYDPRTHRTTPLGRLAGARWAFPATMLADGSVLVAGGTDLETVEPVAFAERFDPVTERFSMVGAMAEPRHGHSLVALPDGRALAIGGRAPGEGAEWLRSAEIFDPASRKFAPVAQMPALEPAPRLHQFPLFARGPAVVLPDGRVFVAGLVCQAVHDLGRDGRSAGFAPTPALLFDPGTSAWTSGLPLPHCVDSATVLPNGEVFVVGDWFEAGEPEPELHVQRRWSGLVNPLTGETRITDPAPAGSRYGVDPAVLPDGTIVLLGDDGAYLYR
ncbi:MAG TPA: kelch repeat-containing protein [Gemmatimonadota bacterium]|nr:kelch repeat-containing protein [Gemmatimonadota bacterium]